MNSEVSKLNLVKFMVLAAGLMILFQSNGAFAKGNSYVCNHPDKPGGWGALDLGCDADQYGDVKRAKAIYPMLIFDRRPDGADATAEYITNVQATIKEIAKEYYLKRVPNAKPATLAAWMNTAVAIGAHESMLSHYRISKDNRYKFMTGDKLISHGIMQVNQEFHANKDFDSSFDFVGNVVAALDYYFEKWNKSVDQGCYQKSLGKNPSLNLMLLNRARSAYSSYNSGSNFCRFTDLKATWARNDKHFFETLTQRPWKKYVKDEKRASPVNVKCLIEGDDLCAMAKPSRENFLKSRPLILADGRTCITIDGVEFSCATDTRVFSCLAKITPEVMDAKPLKIEKLPTTAKITVFKDREPVCQKAVQGLFKVGQSILLKKEILMRDDVDGSPIGNTKAGRIYQILDYDIRLADGSERYYQIKTPNGTTGWIFGGTNDDLQKWVTVATDKDREDLARADAEKVAALPKPEPTPEDIVVIGHRPPKVTPAPAPVPAVVSKEQTEIGKPTVASKGAVAKPAPAVAPITKPNEEGDLVAVLPIKGSIVEIVQANGIVMRSTPGEDPDKEPIFQLYMGARLTVEDVTNKGSDNQIFLKVTSGTHAGWIYVGHTTPMNTVPRWIKIWK